MARPETPIPERRPMKALAECLRRLRREAGSPTYRTLSKLVYLEQQSLSQTANGHRVGWGRVLRYVEALRAYQPAAVTTADLAELKQLHQAGERQATMEADRSIGRRQTAALWDEIDSATALSAATAARTRRPGQWHTTRGVTDVRQLNKAINIAELHQCLLEVTERHGLDLRKPSPRPTLTAAPAFSWFGATGTPAVRPAHLAAPVVPRVRGPQDLTLIRLLDVIRACGGTDGDCHAWQSAWDRIARIAAAATSTTEQTDAELLSQADPTVTDSPPTLLKGTERFPAESPLWRWPGTRMRRPNALGRAVNV